MTFSYGYDLSGSDLDRVRFEIGDTGERDDAGVVIGHFLHDEEISGLIAIHSDSWQLAALASIRAIIAKLSRPTFQADWLRVDNKLAIDSYRRLLAEKTDEYGVVLGESAGAWFESSSVDVTRSDVDEDFADYL